MKDILRWARTKAAATERDNNHLRLPSLTVDENANAASRRRVETYFAQLKTTLKMRKVKSKTSPAALKELTVYALVYNLVHLVMLSAAQRQGVLPHRISFIDAVRWLHRAEPGDALPELLINPHRADRHEPRVAKDRKDTYAKMTTPRNQLCKELKQQKLALK